MPTEACPAGLMLGSTIGALNSYQNRLYFITKSNAQELLAARAVTELEADPHFRSGK
jgi:hypothetical protein